MFKTWNRNHEMKQINKQNFAEVLGFKNTMEAICCLGVKPFNNQFKVYNYEIKKYCKTTCK